MILPQRIQGHVLVTVALHRSQKALRWKPYGAEEVLFLSSQSRWEDGHAIRGGVPICLPWFAGKADDSKEPAHGFVRTKSWRLESISKVGSAVAVSMFTESDETTKRWWPAEFRLVYHATLGRELSLEFVVSNTGRTSLRFEEALHTCHRVGNINEGRLPDLEGIQYLDKTDSNRRKMQQGEIVITLKNRSRVPRHGRCNRTCRSCIASYHSRDEREFTHDGYMESVGQ